MTEEETTDVRCDCGALLARRVPEGVELRCRRCRRHVVLKLADLGDGDVALDLHGRADRR